MNCELQDKIFNCTTGNFNHLALEVFRYQYQNNEVYSSFVSALGIDPGMVTEIARIPFLPVSSFKSHQVVTGSFPPEIIFESSGTTHSANSRHFVRSLSLYRESFRKAFEIFYGDITDWCIIGLLPSYLERQHSSLVMMVDELIRASGDPGSAFYLYDHAQLANQINNNERNGRKTLLIGVTYALLDFAAAFGHTLEHTVVMETGGMKGRKKEITREEVHHILCNAWQLKAVHSEYGMTELLSQAYSDGEGVFRCPPWMKILIRDEDDPLTVRIPEGTIQSGLVNVIDLANIYSCSFIATDDLGRRYADGRFEIAGRLDGSDIRGCSLLYA